MLPHMLRTKVQGPYSVLGAWDSFHQLRLVVFVPSHPLFLAFNICLFTLHCVRANKAGVHKKIILENKNEGANSDEYQILLIYSCTISEYKRKVMRLK